MRMQANRVRELQRDISMEQERTNALQEQLQVVNDRLTRVVREVRDRSGGIIDEFEMLIQGVISTNAQVKVPGDGSPRGETHLVLPTGKSLLARLETKLELV